MPAHFNSQIAIIALLGFVVAGCQHTKLGSPRISDEPSTTLLQWLSWSNAPEAIRNSGPEVQLSVCNELAARKEINLLLTSLNTMRDVEARTLLVSAVLYQIDDDRITKEFSKRLNDQETEESYYIANYLAKHGNVEALATLNRHYFKYPVSSWQWSYTVDFFGKYNYTPAATNLVESLDAASLNVVGAAAKSLRTMFPDAPTSFADPTEAMEYYENRLGIVVK